MHTCIYILIAVFISSYATAQADRDIVFLSIAKPDPEGAKKLGTIKIDGKIRQGCYYTATMNEAKRLAHEKGGNIIKLTRFDYPGYRFPCYRLAADIYHKQDISGYVTYETNIDSLKRQLIPPGANYSLLCIYRTKINQGNMPFDIYMEKPSGQKFFLCTVKFGSLYAFKLTDTGPVRFQANVFRGSLPLNLQHGEIYFLKTDVALGNLGTTLGLYFVDTYQGAHEFGIPELLQEIKKFKN